MTNNPLQRYFRQPAIYITLPSKGKFYQKDALTLPPSGELAVYPMTAMDEIQARTPDALFNGTSIVTIVSSCMPDIHDPWGIPSVDLNAILAAIRLASYGEEMDVSTTCPSCNERTDMSVDLRQVMDSIGSPDYDTPLQLGDLTLYFGPSTYKQQTETALEQFESQKTIEMVNQMEMPDEERAKHQGTAFRKIADVLLSTIARSIRAVKSPDAMVTDYDQIYEFLRNCPKAVWEQIRDKSIELREASEIKPLSVKCPHCEHEYEQSFTLNMSNFFETAS